MKCPAADGPVGLQAAGLLSPYHSLHPNPFFPQKVFSVHQSDPQRLSLLELVLDEESVSMVLRRMSPATGSSGDLGDSVIALIQGWSQICSRVGRSEGRKARHHLISCWHSGGDRCNIGDKKSWTQSCRWLSLYGSMLVCRQQRQPIEWEHRSYYWVTSLG